MRVSIGDMTFEGDPKSLNDCNAYTEFLAAAIEVEKARAAKPIYAPPPTAPWPQVPTNPWPIITCSTEEGKP